MTVYHRTL